MSEDVNDDSLGKRTRTWFAAGSVIFCIFVIVWLIFHGHAGNTLHESALSWAFTLMGAVLAGVGFGAVTHFVPLMLGKK